MPTRTRPPAKGFGGVLQASKKSVAATEGQPTQAAGKTLSKKNEEKVRKLMDSAKSMAAAIDALVESVDTMVETLGTLLDEAGVAMDEEEASESEEVEAQVSKEAEGAATNQKEVKTKPLPKNQTLPLSEDQGGAGAQASTQAGIRGDDASESTDEESPLKRELLSAESDFSKTVKRTTWYQRLDTTLQMFGYYFESECYMTSMGSPSDGDNSIDGMLSDLNDVLKSLAGEYSSAMTQMQAVQAAAAANKEDFVQISCSSFNLIEASSENRFPVEIKLFDLDKPSEGVPAVGPGVPLYIPTAVAAEAISQVLGLPLDADHTLATHANNDIVGCMLNAQIRNGGFWIRGHLYPFNQPERVAKIKAEKDKLGASINALAPGHVETINGRRVHVVDKLTLLGACVLYADNATFSKTQVVAGGIAEESLDSSMPIPVAATVEAEPELIAASATVQTLPTPVDVTSADTTEVTTPEVVAPASDESTAETPQETLTPAATSTVTDDSAPEFIPNPTPDELGEEEVEEINKQLGELTTQVTTLAEAIATIGTGMTALSTNYSAMQQQVDNLLQERDAAIAAKKADDEKKARETAAQTQQQEMMSMMRSVAQDAIKSVFNPSNSPARVTSAPTTVQASDDPRHTELVKMEAQLEALQSLFDVNSRRKRIELRDQIAQLKAQLGQVA